MRMRNWFLPLVGAALAVIGSQTVRGQEPPVYYPHMGAPQVTPASNANLASILERLEALEQATNTAADDAAAGSCKEVDVLTKPTQRWTGRVHLDSWQFPEETGIANTLDGGDPAAGPDDFIGFRRLRFGVAGQVNETMVYKIEMEWAVPEDPAFKDAYLGWTELPFLHTVLMGNQKRPYGLDHLNSSRYNVFLERPFVIEAFNQDARRVGIQSYGVSENLAWNWRWGMSLMDDLQSTGNQRTDNYQPEIHGRLANTIWYDEVSGGRGYAHWAVSGSLAMPGGGPDGRFQTRPEARTRNRWFDTGDLNANTYELVGLEGVINLGALQIVGEYMATRVQRIGDTDVSFGGGYVYAAYFLTGEHMPWDRESGTLDRVRPFENFFLVPGCDGHLHKGWGAWQVAARYSHGDFNDDNVFGGIGNSMTLGLNWWWNPYARMQFNYIYGEIDDRGAPGGDGTYNIFGTRFMCDF